MSKVKYFCIFPETGTSCIWDHNGNAVEPEMLPFVLYGSILGYINAMHEAYMWFVNNREGEYVTDDMFTPFIYDIYRTIKYYHPEEYTKYVRIPWYIPNKRVWRGPDCAVFPRTKFN